MISHFRSTNNNVSFLLLHFSFVIVESINRFWNWPQNKQILYPNWATLLRFVAFSLEVVKCCCCCCCFFYQISVKITNSSSFSATQILNPKQNGMCYGHKVIEPNAKCIKFIDFPDHLQFWKLSLFHSQAQFDFYNSH